jgi:2-aminoethylphosphonate-pyruvate transaminase
MILLNPGPVNLSERVRRALLQSDLCHREVEFAQLQGAIRDALLDVYDLPASAWAAILLTGSGTAAVEAMILSLVPRDGALLVLENGVYGERMSRIADVHGMTRYSVAVPWGESLDPRLVSEVLERHGDITHVAVVHHETTTGRLNDLASIAARCRERGVALLVDAVSSFAAESLDFEEWGIAGCAATANKCLHAVPGVSFVVTRRAALAACAEQPRSVYLDLGAYSREQDRGGTPFTQSVQCFYALAEALAEFREAGGWRLRGEAYRRLAETVRAGLAGLGIEPLLPPGDSSVVLRAYHLPAGLSYESLHGGLKQRGFIIYAGQGGLAKRIFRISTMGAICDEDMHRLVGAVEEVAGIHGCAAVQR